MEHKCKGCRKYPPEIDKDLCDNTYTSVGLTDEDDRCDNWEPEDISTWKSKNFTSKIFCKFCIKYKKTEETKGICLRDVVHVWNASRSACKRIKPKESKRERSERLKQKKKEDKEWEEYWKKMEYDPVDSYIT